MTSTALFRPARHRAPGAARPGIGATPRTRGAMTGLGLVLLGAWGAVIPFVGSYFGYSYTPDGTWIWTAGRGYLEVLPGAVTFIAGLLLLATARRAVGTLASLLAAAGGAWFAVGPLLVPLWRSDYLGTPVGDATDVSMEQLGMFFGLGAVIMLLAGVAFGRFTVVGLRDIEEAERLAAEQAAPAGDAGTGTNPVPGTAETIVLPDPEAAANVPAGAGGDVLSR